MRSSKYGQLLLYLLFSPITVAARSDSCEYPLPKSYQKLAELFRCADVVVDMLRKREEICTFSKLKKAVEQMSNM